jgi:hypothetical protein
VVGSSAETFGYASDASSTVINLSGSHGGTGTLNLNTLVLTITFNTAPPMNTYSCMFFQWDSASPGTNSIMGIKQYLTSTGSATTMIFDQQRVGVFTNILGVIATTEDLSFGISEIPHDYYQSAVFTGDGMTTTFTSGAGGVTALQNTISPNTVNFYQFTSAGVPTPAFSSTMPFANLITDNGVGGLQGTGVTTASSHVNYTTGAYTITFSSAPTSGNVFDATSGHFGDIFTGSISNFFTFVNYQDCAFFTNNNDPVFYYDGNCIHYLKTNLSAKLTTSTSGVPTNLDITKCLHVTVNRDRLLLLAPTVSNVSP